MRSRWILLAFGAAALASARLAERRVSLVVAGRTLQLDSVVIDGKAYVALDGLKAALDEKTGIPGVEGEWLFNGVWRSRVNGVEWNEGTGFWDVSITLKNETRRTLTPIPCAAFRLVTETDRTLGVLTKGPQATAYAKNLCPGAARDATLHFPGGRGDDRPVRFLAEFVPVPGLPFAKEPSLRVLLK